MSTETVKGLIVTLVNTIKDADNFIGQNINTEYWQGRRSEANFTLDYLRASGLDFSVTEFINSL